MTTDAISTSFSTLALTKPINRQAQDASKVDGAFFQTAVEQPRLDASSRSHSSCREPSPDASWSRQERLVARHSKSYIEQQGTKAQASRLAVVGLMGVSAGGLAFTAVALPGVAPLYLINTVASGVLIAQKEKAADIVSEVSQAQIDAYKNDPNTSAMISAMLAKKTQ